MEEEKETSMKSFFKNIKNRHHRMSPVKVSLTFVLCGIFGALSVLGAVVMASWTFVAVAAVMFGLAAVLEIISPKK